MIAVPLDGVAVELADVDLAHPRDKVTRSLVVVVDRLRRKVGTLALPRHPGSSSSPTVATGPRATLEAGSLEVTASVAVAIAEALSDELILAGVQVRWGAAAAGGAEVLVRGTELENFLVDHWPAEHRDLL